MSKTMWNTAIELLRQLEPQASDEELKQVANFGFGLAAAPQHFIEAINEQLHHKTK